MQKGPKIIDFHRAKAARLYGVENELDRRIAAILGNDPPPVPQATGDEVLVTLLNDLHGRKIQKLFVYYVTGEATEYIRHGMSPLELQLRLSALNLSR